MDATKLINDYATWIKDTSSLHNINDRTVEITTPYLDAHNDAIQIYMEVANNELILTDDGYTLADLRLSGVPLNTRNRKRIANELIRGFGVHLSDSNELYIRADAQSFPQKKHCLLQAIIGVSNMYMLSASRVADIFKDDVEDFLNEQSIRYSTDVNIKGKSGFDHQIDFLIPKSSKAPERFLMTKKDLGRSSTDSLLFSITEMRGVGRPEFIPYVFYKDNLPRNSRQALAEYDVKPIFWDERNNYIEELSA